MSTQSISVNFNDSQRNIPIDLIPLVDEPMKAILTDLHRESPPPPLLTILSGRIKDLTDTVDLLNIAKSRTVKDKLLGLLATGALVGLAAATIFALISSPMLGVGALLVTLGYLLFCHTKATSMGQTDQRKFDSFLSTYPAGVLASPLLLSHFLLTRVSSLQTVTEACKEEIKSKAPDAIAYWSKNGEHLACQAERMSQEADQSISIMQKLPVRSPQGEKDLAAYKDLLVRTRTEIAKGIKMTKNL